MKFDCTERDALLNTVRDDGPVFVAPDLETLADEMVARGELRKLSDGRYAVEKSK